MHDIRFALRPLPKARGLTAVAVVTLARGVGAGDFLVPAGLAAGPGTIVFPAGLIPAGCATTVDPLPAWRAD